MTFLVRTEGEEEDGGRQKGLTGGEKERSTLVVEKLLAVHQGIDFKAAESRDASSFFF